MIAIIAGTGILPVEACKNLLSQNAPHLIISLFPDDNLIQLQQVTDGRVEIVYQEFYKAGQVLKLLKNRGVKQVLLIGKVDKRNLLKNFKLDWLAIKMLASVIYKNDAAVMERIVKELENNGITVLQQSTILSSMFVEPGVMTGKLTSELQREIEFGIGMATKMSELDIGQTVVVKNQMILAIEAIEGTDECIRRGITLGSDNVVVCKAAWQNQNKKFDMPTLGPSSLNYIMPGQVKAIAWLSDKTIIVQKEEFIKMATDLGITLVSCNS